MTNFISNENLIIGVKKCILNAESLIRDATILKENNSIERAYTLFQLSIEESAKASIVYFFATLPESEKLSRLKSFKKNFANHKIKSTTAINFDISMLTSIEAKADRQEFYMTILSEYANLENFNNLKNFSLYTSIVNDRFLLPSETITESHLKGIEARATTRLQLVKSFLEFSLENFEEFKNASTDVDDKQIEMWASEFISDLLKED